MVRVIAVIGSGIAGDEAAFAAKRTDPESRVVVITRELHPLYSACVLASYICDDIPEQRVFLRKREDYSKMGIELLLGKEVREWLPEKRTLVFNDGHLQYSHLILATGSYPFVPPLTGTDKKGVYCLKSFSDAQKLRNARGKTAVVVGSGPVGIEAAVAFRKRGWSVILIELLDRVLPRLFDFPLANSVKQLLEANGVEVRVNERVEEIIGNHRVEAVRTSRGEIPADAVIMVIGMRPSVQLAEMGGLALGTGNAIRVDDRMKTSLDNVWACGDCVESVDFISGRPGNYMLWNNARLQGRVAGTNAAGGKARYPGSLNVTTINFFGHIAASVGILTSELTSRGEQPQTLYKKGLDYELQLVLSDDSILGAQCLGRTELIGGIISIMTRKKSLKQILSDGFRLPGSRTLWALRGIRHDLKDLITDTNMYS